jgi:hypothetical protein
VTAPSLSFEHLFRLSDQTGILEHARGAVPRRESGYCLDDVSRGLVVLSRELEPSARQVDLAGRYLEFVDHAQEAGGMCRNRLQYDRRWTDSGGVGDWWGRALWGLGAVVSGGGPKWMRTEALERFCISVQVRSPWPRALAFAALGAAEVIAVVPEHAEARKLLVDTAAALRRPNNHELWPWPEPRLTYANAAIPEALIAAGAALDDDEAVDDGLQLLSWLAELQTIDDHLSVVPVAGRAPGDADPGFDQQPIEVACLADACVRAFAVTGDWGWQLIVARCVSWFLGANDSATIMHDPDTGGGYDGLEVDGANQNEGAESTIAWLLTLQHGRRLALDQTTSPVSC